MAIPVVVGGRIWGALGVRTRREPFPADTERRMAGFAELVATAITNAEARAELRRMADEQAALRQAATLAARAPEPDRVFAAAAGEVGALIGVDATSIVRFETDGTMTFMGGHGWRDTDTHWVGARRHPRSRLSPSPSGRRAGRPGATTPSPSTGPAPAGTVQRDRMRWEVASPIVVGERLAIAIANIESRTELAASRARVIAAGDATRRRLERDLHDGRSSGSCRWRLNCATPRTGFRLTCPTSARTSPALRTS